jgi:hypothetical protein
MIPVLGSTCRGTKTMGRIKHPWPCAGGVLHLRRGHRQSPASRCLQVHIGLAAHKAARHTDSLESRPLWYRPRSRGRSGWQQVGANWPKKSRRFATSRSNMRWAWLLPAASTACGRSMMTGPSARQQDVELGQIPVHHPRAQHAHHLGNQRGVVGQRFSLGRRTHRSGAGRRRHRRPSPAPSAARLRES